MGKITQEQRNLYFEKVKEYKKLIEARLSKEKTLQELLNSDDPGVAYKRIAAAEEALNVASHYMLVNSVSVALLGIKNEDYLAEARRAIARSIKHFEDTVTSYIDAPFSDYEKNLEAISDLSPQSRYQLLMKLGFAIKELEDAYGEMSRWKWAFIELWGKYATVAKNLLDLKNLPANLDFDSPNREVTYNHLTMVKRLFRDSADKYREKYEIFSNKAEDFRIAILFLNAIRRVHAVLGDRDDVDELKKKADIWTAKLESDIKKKEAPKR